jgi:hypothetical protein
MDKAELKQIIAEDLSEDFLDAEQVAAVDASSWQGAKKALSGAAKLVDALLTHIDPDYTEEQSEAARLSIRRAAEVCHSLRLKAEVHEQRALGRIEAFRIAVKMIQKAGESGTKTPDALDT